MKYNRTFHLPYSPGATNDDRIGKSVESLLNKRIIISEKLDGENCSFTNLGVYARSHATFTTSGWSKEVRQLHSLNGFDIPEDMMIFGENMEGIHSIEYSNLDSYFYVFGIRQGIKWLSWNEVEDWCFLLNYKTVPILFNGEVQTEKELQDLVEYLVSQESKLGGNTEGCIVRTYHSFFDVSFPTHVMKWVRKNHVVDIKHWTRNWKKANLNR